MSFLLIFTAQSFVRVLFFQTNNWGMMRAQKHIETMQKIGRLYAKFVGGHGDCFESTFLRLKPITLA
jgi:hypothetical protein